MKDTSIFPDEIPIKKAIGEFKLMQPQDPYAKEHPATPLLNSYAEDGCPVDCGPDWSRQTIKLLLKHGPHCSANAKKAARELRKETMEKVNHGYARIVRWGDIKNNCPKKLKISPVAMIPHKSKSFRCILDLSFTFHHNGKTYPSVNSMTTQKSKEEAMVQMGQCLKRLVANMAEVWKLETKAERKPAPWKFAKLDIKDGFWLMAVNDENAWNFCYVLPKPDMEKLTPVTGDDLRPVDLPPLDEGSDHATIQPQNKETNLDDVDLVVPNSLQMGWCKSPPFFCSATETARDIIEEIWKDSTLPTHTMEHKMMEKVLAEPAGTSPHAEVLRRLFEIYVDDFIAATNDLSIDNLTKMSRGLLHGIHSIFPPPAITGHNGFDPISEQKLNKREGT